MDLISSLLVAFPHARKILLEVLAIDRHRKFDTIQFLKHVCVPRKNLINLVRLLTLLSAPDLYTASARFRVAFPSEYSPKVYQSTEPKRQETIY